MTTSDNKQLLQRIFASLAECDSRPFADAMAEDFRWIMKGKTAWSRTYEGRDVVREELIKPLYAQFTDEYANTASRIFADGDYVIVECEGRVTTKAGKPYNNQYCLIFRLENGKIKEMTEYLDTALVNDVLAPPPWYTKAA